MFMEYKVKRIGYWSMVKFVGIYGFIIGFLIGGITFLSMLITLDLGQIAVGIGLAIALPIGGAIAGAIYGLLISLFYNILAFFSGGVELTLEQKK